jgi:predicted AlkP superfamily pyrophosphatase or phosphodiesterase
MLFTLTPAANAFVFETTKRAVTAEKLGQRGAPDLLAVNLSTNDYVGHMFGPYSPEVLDLTVQTDRQLADFLGFVDRAVPGGLAAVLIVLTSDHGVAPIPEDLQARDIPPAAWWLRHAGERESGADGGSRWRAVDR